jgi:hypothetical protein
MSVHGVEEIDVVTLTADIGNSKDYSPGISLLFGL